MTDRRPEALLPMPESWADRVLRETRARGRVDIEDFCAVVEQVRSLQAQVSETERDLKNIEDTVADLPRDPAAQSDIDAIEADIDDLREDLNALRDDLTS